MPLINMTWYVDYYFNIRSIYGGFVLSKFGYGESESDDRPKLDMAAMENSEPYLMFAYYGHKRKDINCISAELHSP